MENLFAAAGNTTRDAPLRLALEAGRFGIGSMNLLTGELFLSPRAREIFGFSKEETVTLQDLRARYHPDDRERLLQNSATIVAPSRKYIDDKFRVIHPDGSIHWISMFSEVIRNDNGTPEYAVGITQDITGEMERERILKESEERYRFFVEATTEAIWRFNVEQPMDPNRFASIEEQIDFIYQHAKLVECNEGMAKTYGYPSASSMTGMTLEAFMPRENERNIQYLKTFVESGYQLLDTESEEVDAFGNKLWFLNNIIGIWRDGKIVGSWGTSRNITERKNAELALKESEERFRQLADSVPALIWMSGPDKESTYFNKTWLNFTGRKLEDELNYGWMDRVHPEDIETRLLPYSESFSKHEPFETQLRLRRHDGEYRWMLDTGVPRFSSDGDFLGFAGSCIDITERYEADQRKDEFLAILAHELRNPLAPISNALSIIRSPSTTEERKQEAQDLMDRQVRQLVRLVDDLMDVSRITRGKVDLRKEIIEISDMIQSAVDTVKPLLELSQQTLHIQKSLEPAYIQADPTRISQVIANLLNNAAKYTDRGGDIWLIIEKKEKSVHIRVKDTGIGIPEDKIESIFDMFSQVDNSLERSQSGLGIGLTLARNFIKLHGGTIKAQSDGLGKGSEFVVTLPLVPPPESTQQQQLHNSHSNKRRILVVDDNEASAKTLGWMIEDLGHEVALAHDGRDAIITGKSFRPDIIFMDIGMPEMNGYELCEKMRALPEFEGTVFIAQTGWGQEEHRQKSRKSGFHHHLVKPVGMQTLEEILASQSNS